MSELIDRQAAIDAANKVIERDTSGNNDVVNAMIAWSEYIKRLPSAQPEPLSAVSPWHRVEEPPKEAGEYIVAYHPCWWNDVKTSVTEVGIDTFRGKTSWAKRKFQRITHWMEKPEPPKEDAYADK